MGQTELEAECIEELFDEVSKILKNDKRKKFRVLCLNTDLDKNILKDVFQKEFDVTEQGEFLELFTTYEKYEQEKKVFIYPVFSDELETLVLFTLASSDELSKTIGPLVESTEGIYNLWIPPTYFEKIQEDIRTLESSKLTYFSYENYGTDRKGIEVGKKEGEYRGNDALSKLEKWKKEDDIKPIAMEFEIPPKTSIQINNRGEFTILNQKDLHLHKENIRFFHEKIIRKSIEKLSEMNQEIKASTLDVIETEHGEKLQEKELHIELKNPLDYDEGDNFIQQMENSDFVPFDYSTDKGSLIMEGNIADEKSGGILSLSSDGETFLLLPKFDTRFDTLLRFYRFLIEKVDSHAQIISGNK